MAGSRYEDLSLEVTNSLGSALDRLQHVWDQLGLDSTHRRERTKVVLIHIKRLLNEMVAEEEQLRDRILENIESHSKELLKLSKELGLPPYEPPEGLTNVQLEKDLRKKVHTLDEEQHERVKKLHRLRKEDQHLCDIMCTTPYYIATGSTPSLTQLSELEDHIKRLTAEKERRHNVFTSTKTQIIRMLEDLEQCPNTSFERELCEEEDSFLLTSENMTALKHYHDKLEKRQKENFALASKLRDHMETLWQRLAVPEEEKHEFITQNTGFKPKVIAALKEEIARCELLKLTNIKQVIASTRTELTSWWDKCYYSKQQREDFKAFQEEESTEDLLMLHEDEVSQVKEYYEENKELLELVGRRQTLWDQFLEYERKAADPNRYFNRGCNLLKEEKARKKVTKELPKVEEEVQQKIAAWEKASGRSFIIGGDRFVNFIAQQWEDYKASKEYEKVQRHQAKTKLLEVEMMYGSRPTTTTPGKKRPIPTTPGRTPNKKFRTEKGAVLAIYSSAASSVSSASSCSSTVSVSRHTGSVHGRSTRPLAKSNETSKTPNAHTPGFNRTGRTNYTSVYSPLCMAPRSTHKAKTPMAPPPSTFGTRNALHDQNTMSSNETVFSHTTVSSQSKSAASSVPCSGTENESLASLGNFDEFTSGLNPNARPYCRSSILPQRAEPEPAYF